MALEDDLEALYSSPPAEFVDRRKALAQALRKAGRREDAAAVAGAAKPTPAAWAVNQLAHRHPEEMASLMSLGEALRTRLRAAFAGRGDAGATAEAQVAQREAVARLTRLSAGVLDAAGVSSSPVVLEKVAATLTAISTTGRWGDDAPRKLTRELDPPGFEALAALVADLATAPEETSALVKNTKSAKPPKPPAGSAAGRPDVEGERARREEAARRAAEEARERVRRAEAALESAAAAEEQARSAAENARAALTTATSTRADREAASRAARHVARELQEAAALAASKAESAALAASKAEETATQAAAAEAAAKADLAAAEQAVTRAAAEHTAAEEALVRERRRQQAAPPEP